MRFSEYIAAGKPTGSLDDSGFIPLDARPAQGLRAGLVTRAIAAALDIAATVVVMALAWVGLYLLLWVVRPVQAPTMPAAPWFVLGGIAVLWLGWTIAYATNGRSLGAATMGIRVVDRHGHRLGWLPAAIRSVLNIAFPIGLLWVIPSARNRSVQDLLFGTNVIYAWTFRIEPDDI